MASRKFKPSPRYRSKLTLNITLVALLILAFGMFMAWVIGHEEDGEAGTTVGMIALGINVAWWLIAMALVGPYYRSLRYEICEDEVVVHVGIWTKSVKHVPFRTVTNIVINRDIFDRWFFNTGSLNIQTAGMSGTKGAEEKLVGLPNVHEIYDLVVAELRRFRGGMSPTAADVEEVGTGSSQKVLREILYEIKAIRTEKGSG
ncbi:MAG: PH domain-containing protein [bacterium]|nr:PH domain-containing protein [bacterium]